MGVRIRAIDGEDVEHALGALVGAATVPIRRFRPALEESGRRHGAGSRPHHCLHNGRISGDERADAHHISGD
jgi:hypothetical protein